MLPKRSSSSVQPISADQQSSATPKTFIGRLATGSLTLVGAAVCTAGLFVILPVLQLITKTPTGKSDTVQLDAPDVPPPPPPPEDEPEPEPEPEPPPVLEEPEPQPLNLDMLDAALGGIGGTGPGFSADLSIKMVGGEGGGDGNGGAAFGDLKQGAKAINKVQPNLSSAARAALKGKRVIVKMRVSATGAVEQVIVENCPHPEAKAALIRACKRWRFSPARRKGKAIPDLVSQPIPF